MNENYKKYKKYKSKFYDLFFKKISKNIIQKGGGKNIWIENNFFDNEKFNFIEKYTKKLENKLKNDKRLKDRQTICLNPKEHEELYSAIYDDPKFKNYIKSISPLNFKIRPTFPIEYRKYPTGSKGMSWHLDTSLFEPDCYEIVLTLENTSDSKFVYDYLNKKEVNTKPNTIAIVRPNSILHKVTPVKEGYRTILKFVIEFLDENNMNKTKNNYDVEIKNCPF